MNVVKALEIIFNNFREREGIKKGEVSEAIGTEGVFSVMINAKWKMENNIPLTDLEKSIREESGHLIRMYIAETFRNPFFMTKKEAPFKEWDLTIREILNLIDKALLNERQGKLLAIGVTD